MPSVYETLIVMRQEVAPDHFRIAVKAPEIARAALPGQFAMIQVTGGIYPFLRRPMSFERIMGDSVSFLFKIQGEGTALFARHSVGQTISVHGPLGNGFPVDGGFSRHIFVAGGIGVAPFPPLAEALIRKTGKAPEVILGARTRDLLLCEQDFREMGCAVHIATDDGSCGLHGYAHQALERLAPTSTTRVYACGPMSMMKSVSKVAATFGVDCKVSLEAQMACGDGVCLGCVVESVRESEGEKMMRVCADGPVFDAALIDWEAHNLAYDL
jgi:dihydroorotate dehydrogenase electron transfer subunit